ncbi:MAG: sn-glycerol-3-phosphate ABC transporter ATP-binding protein UgpC [Dehalococcoidales bacterium]|nr:sn-glycerol-3-phosphate ABC transporter ATP-binding protein UgpC [Dehalococcoidales bacterium]
MASVTFKKINKVYDGKVQALKDIELKVNAQDFLVIVGPSGCGKTTLLMILAGLERETSGEVWIDNTCVNNVDPKDRDVAVVFQSYALYPHMTVFGNMAFSLKVRRKKRDFIKARVAQVAEMLNLMEYLKRKPHQLSGGQKQRVAIGRAIVREPKVFLFDEPLSNLDIALRNKMRDELKKLHRDLGATIVYVTHDQVEAMTLATRIVVLNEGEIQQVGTPYEIFMRPETRFVAGLIGSPKMNFFKVAGSEKKLPFWSSKYELDAENTEQGIYIGIRPEDFVQDESGIEFTIASVEMIGSEVILHGAIIEADEEIPLLVRQECVPDIFDKKAIRIVPKIEKLHFFDALTERRVNASITTAKTEKRSKI